MKSQRYSQSRMGLREWRVRVLYLTQEELAAKLRESGVRATLSAVSLWEQGKRTPHLSTQREIARALGLEPWQIAWGEEGKIAAAA